MEYIKIIHTPSSSDKSQLLSIADQQKSETPLLILIIKSPYLDVTASTLAALQLKFIKPNIYNTTCVSHEPWQAGDTDC